MTIFPGRRGIRRWRWQGAAAACAGAACVAAVCAAAMLASTGMVAAVASTGVAAARATAARTVPVLPPTEPDRDHALNQVAAAWTGPAPDRLFATCGHTGDGVPAGDASSFRT
jgi:hypothetical protein